MSLSMLRKVFPKSWFDNIDYSPTENIDWQDAFDPNEARVPKGSPGGGQWTVSGAGAGPAPALTKYAGPFGAKMQNAVNAHINGIGISDPQELAKHIIAGAAQFKSTNVAGYANQLLAHLAKHYGVPPGTFGKAIKKIEGEAIDPPDTPPTDADMDKMAAAAATPEPPAEPAGEIKPLAMPPGDHHPNLALIGDIANYEKTKWPAKEKIEWMKTLLADIPADDTAAQTYAQAQIATLEGNVASWAAPATPAAPLTPKEAWAAGLGPEPPAMLEEPVGAAQKAIYDILNGPLGNSAKIDMIQQKMDVFVKSVNKAYGKQAIAILQGKTGPVGVAAYGVTPAQAPEDIASEELSKKLPAPSPTSQTQGEMWSIAMEPGDPWVNAGKLQQAISASWKPDDQEYGEKLKQILTGVTPASADDPMDKLLTPEQQHQLEATLPAPNGSFTQQNMYEAAYEPTKTANEKIAQIQNEIEMTELGGAKQYGESLIAHLQGQSPLAPVSSPFQGPDLNKVLTPEQQTKLEAAIPMPGGTQSEQDLWETAAMKGWTAAKKIKQLEADMEPNGIAELGTSLISKQINNYAKTLINHLKTWEPPAATTTAASTPGPLPEMATNLKGGLFEKTMKAITENTSLSPAEKIENLNNFMLTSGWGKNGEQSDGPGAQYIKGVIAALGGGAPAGPAEFPKAPAPYVENNPTVKKFVEAAKSGLNTSAQLQTYLENLETLGDVTPGTYHHNYAKQIVAWKQAQEGGAAAMPEVPKPPSNAGNYAHHIFYAAQGVEPKAALSSVTNFLTTKMLAGEIREGSPAHEYAKQVIAALGGTPAATPAASTVEPPTGALAQKIYAPTAHAMAIGPGTASEKAKQIVKYLLTKVQSGEVKENDDTYNYVTNLALLLNTKGDAALTASNIPKWSGMSSTPSLQANMAYNLATNAGLSTTEKIEKIKTYQAKKISEGTFIPGSAVDEYIKSVITALGPTAATEKPQPPPTVNDPKPGSQTQNKMWTVAIDNPSGSGGKTNTQKIAEITKILAESSGGLGGEAEKYANHLITALGGAPTDKTKAQAAQNTATSTTSYTQTPTPAGPPKPKLSFSSEVDPSKYPAWTKAMPKPKPDERKAVKDYTNGYYTSINDALRTGVGITPQIQEWAKHLGAFLGRAKFPEDAVLTRKVSGDYAKKLLGNISKGMVFIDHGFASADHWSGDLTIKIRIKKGQKAAYVKSISSNKPEEEIIIQKGSRFRIVDYDAAQKHITVELMDESDPDYF